MFDVLRLFGAFLIMMSIIYCNLLLASFGVSNSTVRFHPLGVLSNGTTLPVSILYANARSSPKQTHCPCFVMGLTTRGFLTSACRDSIVVSLPFCFFGHKQTSTLDPHNRLASRRVYSGFCVPVTTVASRCWMPCRHHCPARCGVESRVDLSASVVRSDSHGLPD